MFELLLMSIVYYYMAFYAYAHLKLKGLVYLIMTSCTLLFFGALYYLILDNMTLGHNLLCTGIITMLINGLLYINHGMEEVE